jgi:hypothetical protein
MKEEKKSGGSEIKGEKGDIKTDKWRYRREEIINNRWNEEK